MSHDVQSAVNSRLRLILEALSTASFVAIAAAVLWTSFVTPRRPQSDIATRSQKSPKPEPPLPTTPLTLDGAAVEGDPNAKIAMIVYSDFQCPFCAKFARDLLPILQDKYVRTGKTQLAFRHFPLSIHPLAHKAAEAAECAARQGRFWEMHDALFSDPKRLTTSDLQSRAASLRLDLARFDKCLGGEMAARIAADSEAGKALAIRGTPTFFVGAIQTDGRVRVVRRLSGAQPISTFDTALAPLLATGSN